MTRPNPHLVTVDLGCLRDCLEGCGGIDCLDSCVDECAEGPAEERDEAPEFRVRQHGVKEQET